MKFTILSIEDAQGRCAQYSDFVFVFWNMNDLPYFVLSIRIVKNDGLQTPIPMIKIQGLIFLL